MIQNRITALLAGLGLAGILVAQPLFFAPFTIYTGNIDEFEVPLVSILGIYLPPIIVLVGLLGLCAMLLGSRARRFLAIIAALIVCCWLQGNLMVWDYGLLDGRAIDWSQNPWRGWADLMVWFLVMGTALVGGRAAHRYIVRAAVAVFFLQLVLVAYVWALRSDELLHAAGSGDAGPIDPIYEFSTGNNVLHILADGFQSDIFEEIVSDGAEGRRLAEALDGFTFFRENLGVFPYTQMSIPAFLSGNIYRNHVPIGEHMDEAVGGETFLNAAYDSGYAVDIAVPSGLLTKIYERGRYTNFYTIPASRHVSQAGMELYESVYLFDLSLFRLSPHFLKRYVYNDQLWLVRSLLVDDDYMSLQFFSHTAFLQDLRRNMRAERRQPVYKYLHLMLSHNPMVTNENCGYAGGVLPTVRYTVKSQARCALFEIVELLTGMKELGIYDDALIVIMADHGAWVTPNGFTGQVLEDGKSVEIMPPSLVALALPLLAIKLPGETGPLRISDVPSSLTDVPATIGKALMLNGKFDGPGVFDLENGKDRERRFFYYEYQRGQWNGKFLTPIHEFIVDGRGVETQSWRPGRVYFPGGVVRPDQEQATLRTTLESGGDQR